MEDQEYSFPMQKKTSKLKWTILISITCIGILSGIYIFRKPQKIEATKIDITPVQYRQLSNTPTSKPIKAKADVTIQVLNGTGISGQAGLVVKILESNGYSLKNIESGNTDKSDYVKTTITSRADFEEIEINIKELLKPMFPEIGEGVLNSNPNEDSGFDIVITTGNPALSPTISQ